MALRTRSTSARAAIAASRIKQSETERLQSAIKDMESAIEKYNKDKQKRSNKRGLFSALGKLGSIVTKAGAYVGNPLVAGAGLAVSGVSGYAEGSLSKKQAEKAEDIRTDFTEPLSNLLFVGQTAKDVQKGAENLKSIEEQATDEQYAADLFRIGTGLAVQSVTAGQAGTFGEITSDFLNKPLLDLGEAPGEDADAMTKFLYNQRKSASPSVGQLLGGVSPAQQQMGQNFMDNFQSASIAKSNKQSLDALSSLGSERAPNLGFDMTEMLQETSMEMPSFDSLSPGISTSNVFPNFTSTIPTGTQSIAPLNLNQKPIDRFDLIQDLIGRGQSIPSLININTRPSNVQDAFAGLTSTINRYNQGGM
tara:strand:- start:28689 stop:29780 length:1092 start_codon:yes stop_codon:yes gene_type:complete